MQRPVALVTGASRGIGRAIALELARNGFDLAVNDATPGTDLDSAVRDLAETGARALALPFDVGDLEAHAPALEQLEKELGPLSVLVNNAGVGVMQRGDPLDVTEASFDRCMQINAKAVFFLCQAVARRLLAQPKESGAPAFDYQCHLVECHGGRRATQRILRLESSGCDDLKVLCCPGSGSEGIAVYDVQPGLIETPMTAPVIDGYKQRATDGLCLFPWVGQPEDVARVVASLATNRLPYTTGHVISVDGGMLLPRF